MLFRPIATECGPVANTTQSVEPVANTTLASKGSGESVVKIGANIFLLIHNIVMTCYEQEERERQGDYSVLCSYR